MTEPEPVPCPPWCSGDTSCQRQKPGDRYHLSDGEAMRLPHELTPMANEGYVIVYTAARGDQPGVSIHVTHEASKRANSTGMIARQAGETVALLAELLAEATPEAHHQVAAVIRAALAAPASKEGTTRG